MTTAVVHRYHPRESDDASCWCCASVVPCAPHCGNPTQRARYAWTTVENVDRPLCVECCARWRDLALEPGGVMPKRIRELQP